MLQEYGTLEEIYEVIENNPEKELKEFFKTLGIKQSPIGKLLANKEVAFLSKDLATIVTDSSAYDALTLDELQLQWDVEGTKAVFKELEFNSLLEKL